MKAAPKVAVALLAAALIAAACSSSSKSTANSSTTASSGTSGSIGSTGSTSAPITIGTIASETGPLASSPQVDVPVMQAWVAWQNANGGIKGHQVKLIVLDDGSSATTAVSDFKQLQADHVVAIVDETSLGDVNWAPMAQAANIPVIGGDAVRVPYQTSSDFFASSTDLFAAVYGDMQLAKTYGTKLAILPCTESATCAASVAIYKKFGADLGVTIAYTQTIAASTPDFTAVCQALKASGAQSYVVVDAVPIIIRVADQCARQGVTAKLLESSGAVGPTMLNAAGTNGLLSADVDFPFITTGTPATNQFHSVLKQYGPSDLANQPETNVPWAAMQLFGAAVNGVGSAPVTSQSLEQALYTLKGDTLGGLAPPLTFKPGQPNLSNCYFVLGISNGQFTAPKGSSPICVADNLINPIAKAFLAQAG